MDSLGPLSGKDRTVLTVTQLNREARRLLENGLAMVRVEGELSNIARPASGHWYFTLKDQHAQIRCAMFKNRNQYAQIRPAEGQAVVIRGRVSLYEARGDYQLIAENIQDAGVGALQRQFEALKKKLEDEGLFDLDHKQPLPELPTRIGVITSPSGAVIRDILHVLARRFPGIPVRIYPVAVQGEKAAPEIVAALKKAARRKDCDVLILARGGGSLEDLWPFNEESVARAIFKCPLPVISAVGHETDITIADFVADQRAPTPSAAAEIVAPDIHNWRRAWRSFSLRLSRAMSGLLDGLSEELNWLRGRHHQCRPDYRLRQLAQRLDDLDMRMKAHINLHIGSHRQTLLVAGSRLQHMSPHRSLLRAQGRFENLHGRLASVMQRLLLNKTNDLALTGKTLDAVGPQATLERGYSIVSLKKKIVSSAALLNAGDDIDIRMAEGSVAARVTDTSKDKD